MPTEDDDYLEHCVPWTGIEKDLPTGVIGLPPATNIIDLIKRVVVFDDNSDTGLAEIKPSDLKAGDKPVGAKMWEDRITAIGARIRIIDPNGGAQLTRKEWY